MKKIKGDLIKLALAGEFDVIVHGCNCFHTMNSGIARQMRETFPTAYSIDVETTEKGDKSKLGSISAVVVHNSNKENIWVVNGYTQFNYGYEGAKYCDYDAIRGVFTQVRRAFKNQDLRIGYPKIGAGLGGGDWKIISQIIDEELEGEDHTYVEYVPNQSLLLDVDNE